MRDSNVTNVVYNDDVLLHPETRGNPERPERFTAVMDSITKDWVCPSINLSVSQPATRDDVLLVHSAEHVAFVERVSKQGGGYLDAGDTRISPLSVQAALAAVGASIEAVNTVVSGPSRKSFAVVRPPGHHATPTQSMGFCIFNNVAIAAEYAVRRLGVKRVMILDFDVHHGNGTQDAFYHRKDVAFVSIHQAHAYPGTGLESDTGTGDGVGATMNIPLPPKAGDADYIHVFESLVIPFIKRFAPELILVSAGYDAHPNNKKYVAGIDENLSLNGFYHISRIIAEVADEICSGKVVGVLEGGYDLSSLADGVKQTLMAWAKEPNPHDATGRQSAETASEQVRTIVSRVHRYHELE